MTVLPSPTTPTGWRQVGTVVSDLLIATALIWTLPLLLGAVNWISGLLMEMR